MQPQPSGNAPEHFAFAPIVWWPLPSNLNGMSQGIAKRASDGLYAMAWSPALVGQAYVALWKTGQDLISIPLPTWATISGNAMCQWLGDNLVVASVGQSGAGPLRVTEFSLSGNVLTVVDDWSVGDSTWTGGGGSSCSVAGGVAFVQESVAGDGPFYLHVAFRGPGGVRLSNSFHVSDGFSDGYTTCCPGPDGKIWIFFGRDGSACVGLVRLTVSATSLTADEDASGNFIGGAGWIPPGTTTQPSPLAPSGENPTVYAALDQANNRIVLTYQGGADIVGPCTDVNGNVLFAVATFIVGVTSDAIPSLICEVPGPASHYQFPLSAAVFPKPEGIHYWAGLAANSPPDCSIGFQRGAFAAGQRWPGGLFPRSGMPSCSPDGWIVKSISPDPSQWWILSYAIGQVGIGGMVKHEPSAPSHPVDVP